MPLWLIRSFGLMVILLLCWFLYSVFQQGFLAALDDKWAILLSMIFNIAVFLRMNVEYKRDSSELQLATIELLDKEVCVDYYQFGKYQRQQLSFSELESIEVIPSTKLGFSVLMLTKRSGEQISLETAGFSYKVIQEIKRVQEQIKETHLV